MDRIEEMQKINIGEDDREKDDSADNKGVIYGVEVSPPPHLTVFFALQQAILCLGSTLSIPFILTNLLCAKDDTDARAQLLCISMFMCGIATLLQTTVGVRLGIIQGGSHIFIGPIVAMMSLSRWSCPIVETVSLNMTNTSGPDITTPYSLPEEKAWIIRLREIQGNLMLASLVQFLLGCSGLVGFFLQFIGPLTIAPTISLIGLSLTGVAADFNKVHWGIAILTLGLIAIFSLYLGSIKIPFPTYSKKRNCHVARFQMFKLLPVILSVILSWILCHILTITDNVPNDSTHVNYYTRTDARLSVLNSMPWFYFPTPFQFGTPTVSAAGFVGMLGATISSIIESTGDYFAAARISSANPPPAHALNRGIAIEGFSSIISGMVGAGHATTSYSGNIGAIGITRVASRRVFQVAGLILLLGGIIGKFGAALTLIPDPIIGGTLTVVFGMVAAVGISTLQFIDLTSTRNLTILAISLILGLMVPEWMASNKNAIKTGSDDLDQVLGVLLGTAMFVGGLIGFILDNTVPGSDEERGILKWRANMYEEGEQDAKTHVQYEIPFITSVLRKVKCCSYVPVSPTFDKVINCPCSKDSKEEYTVGDENRANYNVKLENLNEKL
ncbi:hypothetical protein FSP39_017881 [Pinctada imbricata]|uniref:Uncharacterized protein n=1 Tax=Pinctada imbricata TaxID=66713 RepID=A0AA88XZW2_PINIB|nr:hypothetical protein FSP39_017881 [Pinctada imbricata]